MGGATVAVAVSRRALEMVEAGLPTNDRPQGMPTPSPMGFPHVHSSINSLRKIEVGAGVGVEKGGRFGGSRGGTHGVGEGVPFRDHHCKTLAFKILVVIPGTWGVDLALP